MGWHIHKKDGKFNIWSTITDSYLIDQWVNEQYVRDAYIQGRLEEMEKQIKEGADKMIKEAKESGFCGVSYYKCSVTHIDEVLLFQNKSVEKVRE